MQTRKDKLAALQLASPFLLIKGSANFIDRFINARTEQERIAIQHLKHRIAKLRKGLAHLKTSPKPIEKDKFIYTTELPRLKRNLEALKFNYEILRLDIAIEILTN